MPEDKKQEFADYLKKVRSRAEKSRVYSKHQDIGLAVSEILSDPKHKALYMKMAKEDGDIILSMAKSVAENDKVENKGAYFMALWHKYRGNADNNDKGRTKRKAPETGS
ncbi:MAG: hypothetical protein PHG66_05340 [Candidatus Colwellbacteria bacterium]|nr:hypothetical protein [Candidatus Colwellbacteria bacterium]